jgi:hypothetical protein
MKNKLFSALVITAILGIVVIGCKEDKPIEKEFTITVEICHLRKGFNALTIDHKKGVLKTAKGLLRI